MSSMLLGTFLAGLYCDASWYFTINRRELVFRCDGRRNTSRRYVARSRRGDQNYGYHQNEITFSYSWVCLVRHQNKCCRVTPKLYFDWYEYTVRGYGNGVERQSRRRNLSFQVFFTTKTNQDQDSRAISKSETRLC